MTQQDKIAELLHKQELVELSANYANAVDRLDRSLMDSLWWPEAKVDVGVYEGNALAYSEFITTPNPGLKRSFHAMSNHSFRITGADAVGQVYVNAASTMVADAQVTESLVGGRYIDEYQQRNGVWKFMARAFVVDWVYSFPSEQVWAEGLVSMFKYRGAAGVADFGHRSLSS